MNTLQHIGMGASDRQIVIESTLEKLDDKKWLYISKSVKKDEVGQTKGAVPMDIYKASEFYQDGKDFYLTEYMSFDLNGFFPMKLINIFMSKKQIEETEKLYRNLQRME